MSATLLVVEDDEKSRRLLVDVLGHHGYAIRAFESGEAGLAAAREALPSLVLLDIQLPGMDGFETLRALRDLPGAHALPMVAVTASVMDHDRRKIIAAGFDAYVPKPVNLRELLVTLGRLLSDRAA